METCSFLHVIFFTWLSLQQWLQFDTVHSAGTAPSTEKALPNFKSDYFSYLKRV